MPFVQGREHTGEAGKQELEIEMEWINDIRSALGKIS
jgi:hypothetical protein